MAGTVDHEKMRENLIIGVIRGIAKHGLEGLTTRIIASEVNMNEAYIYRYFLDRDDLITKAFLYTEEYFRKTLDEIIPIMHEGTLSYREKLKVFLGKFWDLLLENADYCLFYLRFSTSTYMTDSVMIRHMKICSTYEMFSSDYIKKGTSVDMLYHILGRSALSFIQEIALGIRKDTPELREKMTEMYCSIIERFLDAEKIPNY